MSLTKSNAARHSTKAAAGAALAAMLVAAPGLAAGKPSLRDIPEIEDPLFAVAVANEIRETCPTIAGRVTKGIGVLWKLRARANQLGYTDAEITAYVRSPDEKARMRAKGMKILAKYGPVNDPQTYCAYGRSEIAKGSAIGALLKEK
ncbi:DUF5333 domain-containing protein [Chachezhania sediminis]|uniref:DUF5333 domain-containing protein n=1 Tax=Chachezhania sediminis TaxID=2599291 RepID=UPI0018EEFD57|nr:DUF5333 domain-containing protein [Chachezhania sediminis]